MVFKVGDRVDYWQEAEGWKSGRILGRDALNQWIVKLDGDVPYKNFRVKDSDAVELLRHSTAPAPDPKPRPRAGYMPEGELARQLEAAKQFKVGDQIVLQTLDGTEQIGTIASMDDKAFVFEPVHGKPRGHFLNALAFARKLDWSDAEPLDPVLDAVITQDMAAGLPGLTPRKSYELQVGDLLWAGEELVKILDINTEQVLLERTYGIPIKYSIQYIRNVLNTGQWTRANVDQQIAYLTKEADRLDELAAKAIEDRAKVVQQIQRLQGAGQ